MGLTLSGKTTYYNPGPVTWASGWNYGNVGRWEMEIGCKGRARTWRREGGQDRSRQSHSQCLSATAEASNNACARRLGSRAGPRTGKEERGFLGKASKKGRGPRGPRGSQGPGFPAEVSGGVQGPGVPGILGGKVPKAFWSAPSKGAADRREPRRHRFAKGWVRGKETGSRVCLFQTLLRNPGELSTHLV